MMKLTALRNPFKKNDRSPDYKIKNGIEEVGYMYKNRDRSGLVYFQIYLNDESLKMEGENEDRG